MKKLLFGFLCVSLTACNGSGSSSSSSIIQTGNFIDSAVKGLTYKTTTQEGVTDESGGFNYLEGEEVEFLLGEMSLGKALGSSTLYPKDINSDYELNIARVLLTLDSDDDSSNGIDVSHISKDRTKGLVISTAANQDTINHLHGDATRTLKTEDESRSHLDQNKNLGSFPVPG